jgi:hypothetical protein
MLQSGKYQIYSNSAGLLTERNSQFCQNHRMYVAPIVPLSEYLKAPDWDRCFDSFSDNLPEAQVVEKCRFVDDLKLIKECILVQCRLCRIAV